MIENLTESQEKLMNEIADSYEMYVLGGDDSYDMEQIEKSIDFLYGLAELSAPKKIVICNSPLDIKIQANMKNGESIDRNGCGFDAGWTSYFDFMERIGVEYDPAMKFSEWKDFVLKSGIFATALYENVAFVCPRPCSVHRKESGELHNEHGMAIAWRDGYGEYALNGVIVEEAIVMTPAEQLDAHLILNEKNAEVRREIVRKIGIEKVCKDLKAESIDSFGDYELLNLNLGDGRVRPYLKMRNPSLGTYHIEGVGPDIKTVKAALAWRNKQEKYTEPLNLT